VNVKGHEAGDGGANDPKTFSFDAVYDAESTQRAVYDETAFPLVEAVLSGYNGEALELTWCSKLMRLLQLLRDDLCLRPNGLRQDAHDARPAGAA
jgi:hypothetical protein